jgi:hypothetical protein
MAFGSGFEHLEVQKTPPMVQTLFTGVAYWKLKGLGRKNIWREVVHINHMNNVFQTILSGLADDTAKNPKR